MPSPQATTPGQVDPRQVIRNLTAACNELENQNRLLSSRCAQIAAERDAALEKATILDQALETAQKTIAQLTVAQTEAAAA